jgi:DNA invertase Pin-like site-specific DNA recombinase
MPPLRYAIWAAVSTEAQAANDKASLPEQETSCRQLASSRGWIETAGPFIVPGESRTRWVNLRDAEAAMPALHEMLNSAQAGLFDVLVMYNYNRLRDLLESVAKTLAYYRIQIYAITQPVEPSAPDQFRHYTSDASSMMQGLAHIISQSQISDLARKHAYAMPRRINRGLQSAKIPYGYNKPPGRETDHNASAIQNPSIIPHIVEAKNMLLSGTSVRDILKHLEASGIPAPGGGSTWYPSTLIDILTNPFYAGFVRYGKDSARLDPRTGKYKQTANPETSIIMATGQHPPLWDIETTHAIEAELTSRKRGFRGHKSYPLTGLLHCAICGSVLWMDLNANFGRRPPSPTWRCSAREQRKRSKHGGFNNDEVLQTITHQLIQDLQANNITPAVSTLPAPENNQPRLDDLQTQRQRLDDAYQMGLIPIADYAERIRTIQAKLQQLSTQQHSLADDAYQRQERLYTLQHLSEIIAYIPAYLQEAPPHEVNHQLKTIIESITVYSTTSITINYK